MRGAGIVLAGGRSTRMGTDKALLVWRAGTLLDHVIGVVSAAVDGPVIVVGPSRVRSPVLDTGIRTRFVEDTVPGQGPLRGIATGLAAIDADADIAFVTAVDMPFLTPAPIRTLLVALDAHHDAALANGNPLCAAYRTTLATNATDLLEQGERRARALSESVRTKHVEADPALLRDLDTPADLRGLSL